MTTKLVKSKFTLIQKRYSLVDGLFTSFRREVGKDHPVSLKKKMGNGDEIHASGEALDSGDAKLLLAVWGLAHVNLKRDEGGDVRVKTSFAELCREMGLSEETANKIKILDCIRRLHKFQIMVFRENAIRGSAHIKTEHYSFITETNYEYKTVKKVSRHGKVHEVDVPYGKVELVIDPHTANLLLNPDWNGELYRDYNAGQWARVNTEEGRALKDGASLVHLKLSCLVNRGEARRFDVETLCSYAWGLNIEERNLKDMIWKFNTKILPELQKLPGWKILKRVEDGVTLKDKFVVTRLAGEPSESDGKVADEPIAVIAQ